MQKEELRRELLRIRREIPAEQRRALSRQIAGRLVRHPWFRSAKQIFCYVDVNGETQTRELIRTALAMGKQVLVPKVDGKRMEFYPIRALEELRPGAFGIPEPEISEKMWESEHKAEGEPEGLPLMLLPGVAFDPKRNRLGYGGGYYDRYLREHTGFHTVALALDCQIVERVPAEETDIRPELVLTETRILG